MFSSVKRDHRSRCLQVTRHAAITAVSVGGGCSSRLLVITNSPKFRAFTQETFMAWPSHDHLQRAWSGRLPARRVGRLTSIPRALVAGTLLHPRESSTGAGKATPKAPWLEVTRWLRVSCLLARASPPAPLGREGPGEGHRPVTIYTRTAGHKLRWTTSKTPSP